jgi:hypothetical protein
VNAATPPERGLGRPERGPERHIPGGTPAEQEAFGRLVEAFPGSTVGVFEPNESNGQRPIDDPILDEPDLGVLVPLDFGQLLAEGIPETE